MLPRSKNLLLLVILFAVGCSFFKTNASYEGSKKKLRLNLKKWEEFRIDGIVEINVSSFQIRKTIVVRKNSQAIRADVIDSGLFGMRPSPIVSIYFDSLLVVKSPDYPFLENMADESLGKGTELLKIMDSLREKEAEILSTYSTIVDSIKVEFDQDFDITSINRNRQIITIEYDFKKEPNKITFFNKRKESANIKIDRISRDKIKVDPIN
ncbi:MAG: hypothetical protein PHR06_03585 [Candidatus Cloacimonetes bacterium]|nr:hypothetical protein [Candidatus Cloacimonadota bacterium]